MIFATEPSIAVDSKTLRGSGNNEMNSLHLISAYCTENNIVLSQKETEEKSNEITAIPLLLDTLSIKDSTVSIRCYGLSKGNNQQDT